MWPKKQCRALKMLQLALLNRLPFGKFNRASAFPVVRLRRTGLASELQYRKDGHINCARCAPLSPANGFPVSIIQIPQGIFYRQSHSSDLTSKASFSMVNKQYFHPGYFAKYPGWKRCSCLLTNRHTFCDKSSHNRSDLLKK